MKLYSMELSGHAHRAVLCASLLGLKPQIINVDLRNGEHKQVAFLAVNPFGQVPALEDDGVTLYDSNAILVYLASKYDSAQTWYPSDPVIAAKVQIWLSKAANELANSVAAARLVTVFGAGFDHQMLLDKSAVYLAKVDEHLRGQSWFVGENPTIADIAQYSYIAHAPEGGIDLRLYPNIKSWLRRVEKLPGFIPMKSTDTAAKQAFGS